MLPRDAVLGLAVVIVTASASARQVQAQFSRGAASSTPAPTASTAPASRTARPVPARSVPPATAQPPPAAERAGSVLSDARLQDILRFETMLRQNPQDDGVRQNLMQVAWDSDQRTVIVIGLGAPHHIRFMQRRAAQVDCARWFAYHQSWKNGTKQEFGSIRSSITGTFTHLLEEVLPDGRLAVVRQYEFAR